MVPLGSQLTNVYLPEESEGQVGDDVGQPVLYV